MKKIILVVEDRAECREILLFYLRHMGYEAIEAHNGEEAIAHTLSKHPDLILMDIGLPDMHGVEVTTILKQHPAVCSIPVVAITAWMPHLWREKALKAGMAKYLLKPVDPHTLRETIEELTHCDSVSVVAGLR